MNLDLLVMSCVFPENGTGDICTGNPCLASGTCKASGNAYRCYCKDGYYGINCESKFISDLTRKCVIHDTVQCLLCCVHTVFHVIYAILPLASWLQHEHPEMVATPVHFYKYADELSVFRNKM